MGESFKKIETEALSFSHQERSFLTDRLLSSLGEEALADSDAAWIAEPQRWYNNYKEGRRSGIESKNVFAEADRMLERSRLFFKNEYESRRLMQL